MILKNELGEEILVTVSGKYEDDIQIESAEFVSRNGEVPDEDIEFLQDKFADEIYEAWMELRIAQADYYLCDLGD